MISSSDRTWLTDIFCLSFFLLIFYATLLGTYPLFTPDEGRYAEAAREMLNSGDFITPRVNGIPFLDKPIFYYWLEAASFKVFGINEWSIRFFPMFLGIVGCLVTYSCGRLLFNRPSGWLAALILATTPLYFVGAHYANLDLEVAVFISCSLLFFITGMHLTDHRRPYFLYTAYCFAALACLTKGLIGIVFPLLIIGSWIVLLNKWQLLKMMRLPTGLLLFVTIVIPWYVFVQFANPTFLHYFFITQQFTRFVSASDFNNQSSYWFYLPILLIGFFPWTIFLTQTLYQVYKDWRALVTQPIKVYLLLWFLIVFVFFSIPHSKIITYLLPALPPLALLVGNHLTTLKNGTALIRNGSFALITFFFAIGCLILRHHSFIEIDKEFVPYLISMAIVLFLTGIFSLLLIFKKSLLPFFCLCLFSSILLLSILTLGARYINQSSSKQLISQLKPILQPQDEVIHYFKFFQDVPLYLRQRVTLVANWNAPTIADRDNWVRELSAGRRQQETSKWLINEDEFWQRWHSKKRVFVFINENYLAQFKQHASDYFHYGRSHDIILLCNKPTKQIERLPKHPPLTTCKCKKR